jgi:hypothetical protein
LTTTPEDPRTIEIPYRWAGVDGIAHVGMAVNTDPAALGCPEFAQGFPCCTVALESEGRGYDHRLGWMQFVDESSEPGFRIDQHPAFASPLPFLCEGQSPEYFDAPHTDNPDWDFLAHTFLCGKGGELHEFRKEARAILGFKWGFSKQGQRIEWFGPDPLSAQDWDSHREYLVQTYYTQVEGEGDKWSFKPGFSQHPLEP